MGVWLDVQALQDFSITKIIIPTRYQAIKNYYQIWQHSDQLINMALNLVLDIAHASSLIDAI